MMFLRTFLTHWLCWMTGWLLIVLILWAATQEMLWAGASVSAAGFWLFIFLSWFATRWIK